MKNNIRSIHCQDEKSWVAYSQGLLSESRRQTMEEHLLKCDHCLTVYLDILERDTAIRTIPKMSHDLTKRVLEEINREIRPDQDIKVRNLPKKDREFLASKAGMLISYCAAASMALFFWGGGYFDGLADNLSKGVKYLDKIEISERVEVPEKGLIQTGWTHKVLKENRSSFIQNLISDKE